MTIRASKPAFNIREKLKELTHSIGLKGRELMRAATVQDARDLVSAGRKNLAINGDFKISQRGSYTTSTAMANNTYYLDRWFSDHGSTVSATFRKITTDLPRQYRNETNTGLRFEATSSNTNGYLGFRQKYEFMSHLDGKFVTVSAWVKSNKPAVIINYDGSGAPYDYAQHSGSGKWEYLSYTTSITSTSSNHFDIFLIDPITYGYTSITSGDYVEVTNYQIEVGKNATDFEYRSYGEELALCQRYYVKFAPGTSNTDLGTGYMNTTTGAIVSIPFPTTMRSAPTVSDFESSAASRLYIGYQNTTINATSIAYSGASTNMGRLVLGLASSGTTGNGISLRTRETDGFIAFSAEL